MPSENLIDIYIGKTIRAPCGWFLNTERKNACEDDILERERNKGLREEGLYGLFQGCGCGRVLHSGK